MRPHLLTAALLVCLSIQAQASSFTYRGHLENEGKAAEGRFDLEFRLYARPDGGPLLAEPVRVPDVAVSRGQFAIALEFPDAPALAHSAWLEVALRGEQDADYWRLPERTSVALKGQTCPTSWLLEGNAGTKSGFSFLGTTDAEPLELRVDNQRVGRFESTDIDDDRSANVLLGSSFNRIDNDARGATVSGGGRRDLVRGFLIAGQNVVGSDFGTVSGGVDNRAGGEEGVIGEAFATVGGGLGNRARLKASTVAGGESNLADEEYTSVGGGYHNRAIGFGASIAGGADNTAQGPLSGIGGGSENVATGSASFVAGGENNCAGGDFSFAGGQMAKVCAPAALAEGACEGFGTNDLGGHMGTFVWADATGQEFVSSNRNQFLVRAENGFGINTNEPEAALHVAGNNADLMISGNIGSSAFLRFQRSNVDPFGNTYIALSSANGSLVTRVGGVDRLRLFSDGRIGLNTNTVPGNDDLTLRARSSDQTRVDLMLRSNDLARFGGLSFDAASSTLRFLSSDAGTTRFAFGNATPDPNLFIATITGAHLTAAGQWIDNSSRERKDGFAAVDTEALLRQVLELPVLSWHYRVSPGRRHIGPTAEDFHDRFGIGASREHISSIDSSGVALAAIQGLNHKLEAENAALREELQQLRNGQAAELERLRGDLAELRSWLAPMVAKTPD